MNCALQMAQIVAMKLTPCSSDHLLQRFHARQRALDAQIQQVVGQQAAAAAAAEGLLARGVRRHFDVIVGDRPDDVARNLELAAGQCRPCARRARRCRNRGR